MKKRLLSLLMATLLMMGLLPSSAFANGESGAVVICYKMLDEEGNEITYDQNTSECYVRTVSTGSNTLKVFADGERITNLSASNTEIINSKGKFRLTARNGAGYKFVGWTISDSNVLKAYNTSDGGDSEVLAYGTGKALGFTSASSWPTLSEDVTATAVFQKLPEVNVAFEFNDNYLSVEYAYSGRRYYSNSVESYSIENDPYKSLTNGQVLTLYEGDKIKLKSTWTDGANGQEVAFTGYYNYDESETALSSQREYDGVIAGIDVANNGTITAVSVNNSYNPISGYSTADGLAITTRGDYPWTLQSDGSVKSGNEGTKWTQSMLKVTAAQSGYLVFDYKTSTNAVNNFLLYRVGSEIGRVASEADNYSQREQFAGSHTWSVCTIPVTAGQDVYIAYWKNDVTQELGSDAVWLKNIRLASGTYSVTAVSSDTAYGEVSLSASSVSAGTTVTATAETKSGGQFYGWLDTQDNTVVSLDTNYEFLALKNTSIKAIFGAEGSLVARVRGDYFTSVEAAISAAGSGDTVILTGNAGISSDLTIPDGVTLLIPYSQENTVVNPSTDERPYANTEPAASSSATITAPGSNAAYTLTVSNGASVTVGDGAKLIIGGVYGGGHPVGGQVCGAHGELVLQSGTSLNVGGVLSASGYITGEGSINVTGGSVYENFVVTDYHGGTYTMNAFTNGQSPFDGYTMMNIRSTVNFDSAASLFGYCSLYAANTFFSTTAEVLGGSGALIHLANGSVTLVYNSSRAVTNNGSIGTMQIDVNGDATIDSLTMDLAGMIVVTTSTFECPLSYNFVINQHSGEITLNSKIKLMPGAEINVDAGASMTIASGATLTVYASYTGQNSFSTYPTAAQLTAAGMPTYAKLQVAGTLNLPDGARLSGAVRTLDGAEIVIGEAALTGNTYTHTAAMSAVYTATPISAVLKDSTANDVDPSVNTTYRNVEGVLQEVTVAAELSEAVNFEKIATASNSGNIVITVTDGAAGEFTVECARACIVLVQDGDEYIRLSATAEEAANTYSYTASSFDENTHIIVAMRGDVTGDAKLSSKDATLILKYIAKKTDYETLDWLIANINDDNKLSSKDATLVLKTIANKDSASW